MIRRASFVFSIVAIGVLASVGCSSAPSESTGSNQQPILHTTQDPSDNTDPPYVCPQPKSLLSDACGGIVRGYAVPKPSGVPCPILDVPELNAWWRPAYLDATMVVPYLGDNICAYPFANVMSKGTNNLIPDAHPVWGDLCAMEPGSISYLMPIATSFTIVDVYSGATFTVSGSPSSTTSAICTGPGSPCDPQGRPYGYGVRGCGTCIQ